MGVGKWLIQPEILDFEMIFGQISEKFPGVGGVELVWGHWYCGGLRRVQVVKYVCQLQLVSQ